MARKNSDVIIINGLAVPAPDEGFTISESTYGDFGRNAKNQVIGQVIGRNLWKIDGLQWSRLTVEQWKAIKNALSSFFVPVTFTDDANVRHTLTMYPSDRKGQPMRYIKATQEFDYVKTCKFNLIDCGWDD